MDSQDNTFVDVHYTAVEADIEGCAGLLKTVLEITMPSGLVEALNVDSDGVPDKSFIKLWDNTPEKKQVKFVLNKAMMTDTNSALYEFANVAADVFTVPMRFAHYKTPIQANDDPLYSEAFEVVFREQTMAEKCDIAQLVTTTLVADQAYEVTKDNNAKTTFGKSVVTSTLTDCTVTTTLQVLSDATTDPHTWVDYSAATSDYPFIATYDDSTKGASIGFDW
jgi:hypothetical protein